jgi:hypothetical protein
LYGDAWSIEFEYKVHGRSTSLFGDGFAFWFTMEKFQPGGELLGGKDHWNGLVIAFDTYDNGQHGVRILERIRVMKGFDTFCLVCSMPHADPCAVSLVQISLYRRIV